MQDPVRCTSMCDRCQAHQREVEALSRTIEDTRDRDEIAVSRLTARQLDERHRRAEVDYRRGSRPPSPRRRAQSPRRRAPSPPLRSPSPRPTRGHASRAQEDEEALAEEEEQYRYNRRREELRRREEQRRREEYRRGYPTSDERRRRSGYY